ncbi:hypothetical protein K474DRAFT_1702811 [Panus rudis PR-1116 ss-1]|nr:hypothetical protein K474DRAFT_1702811 [Panus rudis PR-1116 ss-1]
MSLAAPAPAPERISQILPSVKCSSCNQPVPISELGDHVCAPAPPLPKPPLSPRSATPSFMSQKYQNVITRSQTPPIQGSSLSSPAPPRQPSPLSPQRINSPAPQGLPSTRPLRTRAPSNASTTSTLTASSRPDRVPTPSNSARSPDAGKVAFPSHPGPSEIPRTESPQSIRQTTMSMRSGTSMSNRSSSSSHVTSPLSSSSLPQPPQPNPAGLRARAPSNASTRSAMSVSRQPLQSSPTPYVPPQMTTSPLSPPNVRPRAVTNAGPPQTGPDLIYSTGRQPSPNPAAGMRSPGPSEMARSPLGMMSPPLSTPASPMPMGYTPPSDIDTKTGGEAGMAGVGRRGFAAAARAAMMANTMTHALNIGTHAPAPFPIVDAVPGMDGRRANAPRFLDISSAVNYGNTPPLSPNSASSHSPHSPLSVNLPSPNKETGRTSTTPTQPAVVSRTPSPTMSGRPYIQGERVIPPALEVSKEAIPATPTTPVRLPFFEKFKNMHAPVDVTPLAKNEASPASPISPSSESSYGGLAYADSSDDESEKPPASAPAAVRRPSIASVMSRADVPPLPKSAGEPSKVRFPSMSQESESSYTESTASPRVPMRSLSTSTTTSSYLPRTTAKSTGALDRAMETLFEEEATSPTVTSTSSPALLALGESHRDSKPPKLPTRSHTSPTLGTGRPDSRHGMGKKRTPKIRVCVKCDKHIDDGRWIQMDGGSVLCDRCWKNMYLPKCRRCNKTIEKQAVSSSDGQLKGKYHRECFSCHTCHKPFPDKSFYVFDGKPFCAYHYHEANGSLCAAATCGQPIEGPCAVSHSGDKYHPDHFLCEAKGCKERLVEYWELDGRMLCEKHAQTAMVDGDIEEEDPLDRIEGLERRFGDDRRDSGIARAMKRTTRFIDLASLNANAGGGVEGSELR